MLRWRQSFGSPVIFHGWGSLWSKAGSFIHPSSHTQAHQPSTKIDTKSRLTASAIAHREFRLCCSVPHSSSRAGRVHGRHGWRYQHHHPDNFEEATPMACTRLGGKRTCKGIANMCVSGVIASAASYGISTTMYYPPPSTHISLLFLGLRSTTTGYQNYGLLVLSGRWSGLMVSLCTPYSFDTINFIT